MPRPDMLINTGKMLPGAEIFNMYTLKLGNVRVTVKDFQTILVTPQITTHAVVATAIFPRSEQILNIEKE